MTNRSIPALLLYFSFSLKSLRQTAGMTRMDTALRFMITKRGNEKRADEKSSACNRYLGKSVTIVRIVQT
jgi:hypothetical protein